MHHQVVFPKITASHPLEAAVMVFTDGSSTGKGAYVILGGETVTKCFQSDRPQIVECQMVLEVIRNFPGPLNIYSDSLYVVNAVRCLEASAIISTISPVSCVFLALRQEIRSRKYPFYITHIRAHSLLPGPLDDKDRPPADKHASMSAIESTLVK